LIKTSRNRNVVVVTGSELGAWAMGGANVKLGIWIGIYIPYTHAIYSLGRDLRTSAEHRTYACGFAGRSVYAVCIWIQIVSIEFCELAVDSSDSLGVNSNRANYPLRIGDVLSLLRTSGINDKLRFDEVDVDQVTHCGQKNLTSYQRSHK